jgi:hypothetical protein
MACSRYCIHSSPAVGGRVVLHHTLLRVGASTCGGFARPPSPRYRSILSGGEEGLTLHAPYQELNTKFLCRLNDVRLGYVPILVGRIA